MAQKKIDIGVQGNDGTGDSIRTSFQKVNDNFSELYAIFGGGGSIRFTNLSDAPASYKANQIIMAATTGGGLTARDIVVGEPAIQFSIDATSDNTKLIIHPPTSSLSTDQNPTLGGHLNAQGAYSVVNLADPSEALVQAFNNNTYNKTHNIITTLESLAVTKGYADANYLKVSKGQITSALNVRAEPLTPQVNVTGYDPTLTGNYLSTEAMQRKDVVYRGGDTMTGALNLSDHPSPLAGEGIVNDPEDLQAATKYYVDNSTYYSGVNLYVTTKGDDLQTHTPAGREGRAWQYAYATVGKAALQAENLISLSNQEPGPYRQTLSYTIGANQFNGYVYNAPATQKHLVGLIAGSSSVQGVLDAASLLEYNRSFIQQETISFINKKYVNKSVFDQTRWESIISNIINGVAYDLALNTTFNSMTQASILFNSYNADIITNELTQVRDAVSQIEKQILEYSYDSNVSTALQDYLHRILFALSYDFAIGSNYQSIQAALLFPYANNSIDPNAVPDFSSNEIVSLLDTSSITITNAIGNGTEATITFDEQVGIPFQVNEQILITGVSTSGYNSSSSLLGYWTVLSCDTTYVTFACTTQVSGTGGSIVRNNLINNLIATVGVASIATTLQTLAGTIVRIILTGQTPTPSFPATSSSLPGSFSAANLLVNNISFIQSEISGFLTSKYSNVGYDKALSKRDIQAIVWSLVYDLMYGGNSQSTYAGNRYWYGGVNSPHLASNAQQSACIDAIDYIGVLAQNIITNTAPSVLYQTTVFQYTNETYAGGSVASSSINSNIALIASILSGSGVVAENVSTGLYGTAPSIPGSSGVPTYDKFNTVIHNPTTNGPIPTIILKSVGYIKAINGLINNSLLGTASDGPNVNTISAKFNVIQKLLKYGVSDSVHPRGLPYYTNSGTDYANQAKAAIFANVGFLQSNINAFIVNNNSGIVFDRTSSARDISAILEAICYDLMYGGNSATVQAALQYYANGTLQLAAGRNTSPTGSCYTAISELREEVVQILKNQYVSVQSGNSIGQATPQPLAWGLALNAENQVRGSFSLILDVLSSFTSSTSTTVSTLTNNYVITYPTNALGNSQGTSGSQSLLLINSDPAKGPKGAWNIITDANSTITSYVYNYLATTYTGGLTYNEATCIRDIGLMVDAVVIDILTGTSSVPANYQTVQAGKSYYRNASALKAITGDQLSPTTQAIQFVQSLAAQVLNQTQELRFQSLVTQNSYNGVPFSVDATKATTANADFAGAVAQVNSSFTTILRIIEKGLSAAPTAVQGSGYYGVRVYNGGVGSVDQGQAADNHIIPGKILIGNTSKASAVILSYSPGGSTIYDTLNVNMLTPGFFIPGETLDYAESVGIQQVTIRVEAGIYYEDYPIRLAQNVTVKGDDFRRTIIRPIDRPSKSPWVSLFFYRDGIFDGMQIGPIDYSNDFGVGYNSTITLSASTGTITATLASGQVPASWIGLVLTQDTYKITQGTVFNLNLNQYCSINFVSSTGSALSSSTAPYKSGDSIVIEGMSPTNYNGTFTVATCTVGASTTTGSFSGTTFSVGSGTVIGSFAIGQTLSGSGVTTGTVIVAAGPTAGTWIVNNSLSLNSRAITATGVGTVTFINNQAVGTATSYGQIATGKAVVDSVSGNVMNCTVVYPFSNTAPLAYGTWHLYTTSNYGRHYLTNPLDINSIPKNNKQIDVFLCNDATRISNISAQGHGGFMMVLDPEGQIKSKSPYGQESGCFTGSTNKKNFAGGQLIDGMTGRLFGTVVNIDAYPPNASATQCTIAGNTLTIGGTIQGIFVLGMTISGSGIVNSPYIQSQISGTTGGAGTYQISSIQTVSTPETIIGANGAANTLITVQGTVNSGLDVRPPQVPCSFYLQGYRYQIDEVYDYNGNATIGSVTYSNTNSDGAVGTFKFTVTSTVGITTGMYISGTGIPTNASPAVYIAGISGNTITLSNTNFVNGVAWTGLTAQANGTYNIGAPQTRLILDTSTPFATASSYSQISSYFTNIFNAVTYDAALGTTSQTVRTGLVYIQPENIVNGLTQVLLNIGINYINNRIAAITTPTAISSDFKTAVTSNLALIYGIINNGITAIPKPANILYPHPLNVTTDQKNARHLLRNNRTFVQQEVTAWLSSLPQFSLQTVTGYSPLVTQQDIGYIVDAVIYDTLYGGNSQTNQLATQYFWWTDGVYYYNSLTGKTVQNPDISRNTVLNVYYTAFEYTKSVLKNIIQGITSGNITTNGTTTSYPSAGNGVVQYTTLSSGVTYPTVSSTVVTGVDTLVNLLKTYWTANKATRDTWASTQTITTPTISSSTSAYSTDFSSISSNASTILNTSIPNYLISGNVPINIEMGGNKSMLANDFTQVCDLGYGIVATNAGLTEQVSTFTYYNHVGYYSLNGGQIRSVAGSNGYGDYGLRASGADSTELPNAVNLVHDLIQTARVYKQGQYSSEMGTPGTTIYTKIYIIGYEYIPYAQSYIDIDHSVEGGGIVTYQVNGISHTSVTIGQNVLQLTITSSTGLAYALRDGQLITLRTNTYVEFTNISNVKPVRPSTALQYSANLSSIYRVLSYNLNQATGEAMSTPTNAILQTANGFAYYTFVPDTTNIVAADPTYAIATASVSSFTGSTLSLTGITGTISIGQVVGNTISTAADITNGQATGYIYPAGLTVTYVNGGTVVLSGTITSATGNLSFGSATQGATPGDNNIAVGVLTDQSTINQINTGNYSLAWNGRTHQVLGYQPPLYSATSTYSAFNSGTLTLTVNNVTGNILPGQLITGTGWTGQYVTAVQSIGVVPGGSTLQAILTISATVSGIVAGASVQFGFNINGYLQLALTPIYNNASIGIGLNGLEYVKSSLEPGSTQSELVTYKVPYSSAGTLPPVDSTINIAGYTVTTKITGYISGTTLTVSSVLNTGDEQTLFAGMVLTATSGGTILSGTTIVSNISGSGAGSTWTVSQSQTVASSGSPASITATNLSYDAKVQVTNVVNTTNITTSDVSKLVVGMVVSLVQTTGYVVSVSSNNITLSIPTNSDGSTQAPMFVGQQVVFNTSSATTFGGISTSTAVTTNGVTTYQSTYFVTYVSGNIIKISVNPTLTPLISGTGTGGYTSITGSISGNILTVTVGSGIVAGMLVFSSTGGVTYGTYIQAFGTNSTTGTGGIGTYSLSVTQSANITSGPLSLSTMSFTTGGGNVPSGTIVQSVNTLTNSFVVSPACWIPNGATVSCIQYAYVSKVIVTNKGSGYTTAPVLTFSGGGASSQAIATVTIDPTTGSINDTVTIVSQGYGYTSAPTISLSSLTGSVSQTIALTNLITVNSTAGLSSGASIIFTGIAGSFANTVYSILLNGSIAAGTGAYSGYGVATITGTSGIVYNNMTLTSSTSIATGTTIVNQISGASGNLQASTTVASGGGSGTNTFVVSSATGIVAGQLVTGTGIPVGTYVKSNYTSGTTITLVDINGNASNFTTNATGTYSFYTPNGAGTYLVSVSQVVSAITGIIGTVGGLSSTQTYTINQVIGATQISVFIYGSTTSPILGNSTVFTNNSLGFSVPGNAVLTAQISQFANPSVTTTGGTSTVQLTALYAKGPGVFGTMTQTAIASNAVTISSINGLTVGQQIIFTGTAFGNIVSGTTYYIASILTTTSPYTITISQSSTLSPVFVPSSTTTSSGSMQFYCPNFIDQPTTTVSSYSTKALSNGQFNITLNLSGNITVTNGKYYNVSGNNNNLYNGIWLCASAGSSSTNVIILTYPYDPGTWDSSLTTTVGLLQAYGTGSAIGISKGFSTSLSTTLFAGYSANTGAQITQRISLTRATGHDFAFIGTGGYNTSNYPNQIYGNPAIAADNTKQVLEEGVGRCFYVTTDENGIFRVGKFFTVDQGTGTVSISQNVAFTNVSGLQFQRGVLVTDFSSDSKMTENASDIVPVQSAIRSFIDYRLGLAYGGDPVPNYNLIGPGYMALNGALAMTGQMNMGGNGIINMNMPVNVSPTNATNKGYVDTQDTNQNSIFKLVDTTLPYSTGTARIGDWTGGISLAFTPKITATVNNPPTTGMYIYGGGTQTIGQVTTYAFDGTQQITAVTLTTTSSGDLIASITLSKVPNFTPIGVVVFTSIVTGSQMVYDAPSSTWKAAVLAVPSSGPITTTGVSTNNGVATFTFGQQATQPFQAGQTIVISGTTNNSVLSQSYNGIWTVLASPAPTTTSVSIATASTGALTTQGTIIGNTTGLTYNSASGTITTSINSGSIVDSMVGATAAIQQSKLLMQSAVTLASAPSGLQSVIQAASGLSSFNSLVFTSSNGWIDLKTATSDANGVQLGKITYIPAGTILYNNTGVAASPTAVTPSNVVSDGNGISNSAFAGAVGVMTVTANGNNTSPGGVTKVGGANTYDVVQVSQANAVATGTGGLNQHQANSFIKSGSDGSVDVGILQVQGTPIITATPNQSSAQLTFGFPSANSVNTATFTGGISSGSNGGNLVISSSITGIIAVGMSLTGGTTLAGTVIIGGSGNSWTVYPSQTVANGTVFTATLSPSGVPGFMVVGLNASNAVVTTFLGQTYAPIHQASTFQGVGGQTISAAYNGGWTITGSTQLSSSSSFTVGNAGSGGSATTLYGTLSTYNSITMNGGAGKSFTITNGAGTPVTQFSVDSNTGNTNVTGSFFVNTNKFSVDATTGNTTIAGNLVVQGTTITVNSETVNNNETITGTLAVSSTTDSSDTGTGAVTVAGGVGIGKKLYVGSNLSVTGTGTLSVNSGSTTLGGTLSVTGDTSLTSSSSSALTVTGGATFNSNVTLAGSTGAATEYFKITAGPAGSTTFSVDSAQGNTVIGTSGTLTLAAIAANGSGSPATGTITGAWSTGSNSSLNLASNSSTLYVKNINATDSGTAGSFTGLWTFNNSTNFSSSIQLTGSTTANAKFFKITDGTTQRFYVDSSTGSVTSTGNITLTGSANTITLSGTNARVVSNITGSVYATDGTTLLLDATNKALVNTTLSAGLINSGTLSADRGGTGASGAQAGIKALLNGLPTTPANGYFLASNGSDSYFWASPTSISQTNVGTRITSTRKTWKVGVNGVVAGQTQFTDVPTYATGQNNLRVYLNGVRQNDGNNDYVEVGINSFTLGVGLSAGDVLLAEIDANYSYVVSANNVVFNAINGVSNTDVQGAITTLQNSKMPYSGGQFNNDVSTAGAVTLTLGAGSASKAPLKLTDGTLVSAPQSGMIEFNSGLLYYTDNANTPARQTVASQSYVTSALSSFSSNGSLDASTLKTGTIPSATLGNSTLYVGTTAIALNRASANLGLGGITSIVMPGSSSGTITLQPAATAGTTTITFPATTGTVAMSGDTFYIGSTQIANNRANAAIALTGITSIDGKANTAGTADTANALNTANAYRVNALGVNVDPSLLATGEIRASNNITAYYSDDRLKTRLGGIENALDKLCSLEGFYYEANETAQALGYEVKKEVGLSAQSVQKVLPEIVAPAPIDEKYLTIRYERIAPLVVEAIKELRKEISDIKKHLGI